MAELNIVEKVIALEGVDLLQNLNPDQLARIASIATEVRHPEGKVILQPSAPLDALYVVLDGSATTIVVPPLSAARVPLSKSSAE